MANADDTPKCPRCFAAYDAAENEPRILTVCGHSLCKKCLKFMLRTVTPMQIKCPQCQAVYKFSRKDILNFDKFPANNDLLRIIKSQAQLSVAERCRRHDKESTMFCFDPVCHHKSWTCPLCIRDHHKSCNEKFIIQKSELNKKVSFLTKTINLRTIKDKVRNQVKSILEDFEHNFVAQAELIADESFQHTADIGINDLSHLGRNLSQISIVYKPDSKKIVIKRKDEEEIAEKARMFEHKVSSFLIEELDKIIDEFMPSLFDEGPREMRLINHQNRFESHSRPFSPDFHLNFDEKYKRVKEQTLSADFKNATAEESTPPSEQAITSETIHEMVIKLPPNKYIVLEFTDRESVFSTRTEILGCSNLECISLNKRSYAELFAQHNVERLPTFVCYSKNQNTIKKFRLEDPDENLLVNTLFDLSRGLLTNS